MFYRTNAQTRALEEIFVRSALPYRVVGGTKFYERAEIKDAMAYLIAVANPADELALRRILNTPKRGIGRRDRDRARELRRRTADPFRDALRRRRARPRARRSRRDPAARAVLDEAAAMLARGGGLAAPTRSLEGPALAAREPGFIDALRNSRDPQDETRAENVEELVA